MHEHAEKPSYTGRLAFLVLAIALCSVTARAATLTVTVDNVQTTEGQVLVAIYNEAHWMKQNLAGQALKPTASNTVVATFELPPGRYAAAVLHDMNDNGRMDYRLLRLPKEPYGFSNGAKPKLRPPTFEDAAFDLADEGLAISIVLND